MSLLQELLAVKQYQDQQREAEFSAIPNAVNTFLQARQTQQDNLLKNLTTQATLAKAGLRYDPKTGGIAKDASLMSEEDLLDTQLKQAQLKMFQGAMGGGGSGLQLSGLTPAGPTFDATTGEETLDRAFKIQDNFLKSEETKSFNEIRGRVGQMDELLNKAKDGALDGNNALDQALITTFNKINDPGSVVRESEYARTQADLSAVNRILGALGKFQEGGAGLTAADRKDLVTAAKIIANERGRMFNDSISGLEKRASAFGVKPETVLSGIDPFKPYEIGGAGQVKSFASLQEAEAANLPKGSIIMVGGKKARVI